MRIALHPNGHFLALQNNELGLYNLYALKRDRGGPPSAASCLVSGAHGYDLNWSPDGRK